MGDKAPVVLVIPDGHRRYARRHGIPIAAWYAGMPAKIAMTAETLLSQGITKMYVVTNSVENLDRPAQSVRGAWLAYLQVLKYTRVRIRFQLRGDLGLIPEEFRLGYDDLVRNTVENDEFTIIYVVNWSLWNEVLGICNAARRLSTDVTRDMLPQMATIPEPVDLIIRTGDADRLSQFFPLLGGFAEIAFLRCMWPEVTAQDILNALAKYYEAVRRYGV